MEFDHEKHFDETFDAVKKKGNPRLRLMKNICEDKETLKYCISYIYDHGEYYTYALHLIKGKWYYHAGEKDFKRPVEDNLVDFIVNKRGSFPD